MAMNKIRIIIYIWIIVILAVGGYVLIRNGEEEKNKKRQLREEDEIWQEQRRQELETVETQALEDRIWKQEDIPRKQNIEMDKNFITVEGVMFQVVDFQWIQDISEIENAVMKKIMQEEAEIRDDMQMVLYTVELKNETEESIEVNLKNLHPVVLNEQEQVTHWMEAMYFEFAATDRGKDSDNMSLILEPQETYTTAIVAIEFYTRQEFEELMRGADHTWYLGINPTSHEWNTEDKTEYFLKIQNDVIRK